MQANYYRSFDQLRTNELYVVRHGWYNSSFELTDGQFNYGTISFRRFCRRSGTVETANGSWEFSKPFFSRVATISKPGGELIGKVDQGYFDRCNKLVMNGGFAADFKRTGFFPTEFTWSKDSQGEILRSRQRHFNFNSPLTVILNPTVKITEMPLLTFLSIYLLLLRQRRKGAAH